MLSQKQRILAKNVPIHDVDGVKYKGENPSFMSDQYGNFTKTSIGIPFVRVDPKTNRNRHRSN